MIPMKYSKMVKNAEHYAKNRTSLTKNSLETVKKIPNSNRKYVNEMQQMDEEVAKYFHLDFWLF